jgi:hypothetical protein
MVLDAHCREGAEACMTPLLGALGRHAVGQGLKGIQASLPVGHPLGGAFAALPSAGVTTEVRYPLMMRVVDLPGRFGLIGDGWRRKARSRSPSMRTAAAPAHRADSECCATPCRRVGAVAGRGSCCPGQEVRGPGAGADRRREGAWR